MESRENTKRITQAVEGVGVVFIAAVLFFWMFGWADISSKQIGSYPTQRLADGTVIPLNRTIYKVNPFVHTVIYWMPDIDETPRSLVNCTVRDKKNWVGSYYDGSGTVEMRKGRIVTDDPNITYVGRSHWWLLHFEIVKK